MPRPYDHHSYVDEDAADRRLALQCATQVESQSPAEVRQGVLELADDLYAWLRARPSIAPARLILTAGAPFPQNQGGITMTAQLNLQDNQAVTFTVSAEDAKGFAAADGPFTWVSPDDATGQFITLSVSADTTSCTVTAVAPGQGTVQVTDPSGIQGAELCVVTAGPVASLTLTPGAPVSQ